MPWIKTVHGQHCLYTRQLVRRHPNGIIMESQVIPEPADCYLHLGGGKGKGEEMNSE